MFRFNLRHLLAIGLLMMIFPILMIGCGGSRGGGSNEPPPPPSTEHVDTDSDPEL